MRRGRERSIASAIGRLKAGLVPADPMARLLAAWPSVVGGTVADETRPRSLSGSTLTVECSSAVWAQELSLLSRQVVSRLGDEFPEIGIEKLRCVVGQGA